MAMESVGRTGAGLSRVLQKRAELLEGEHVFDVETVTGVANVKKLTVTANVRENAHGA